MPCSRQKEGQGSGAAMPERELHGECAACAALAFHANLSAHQIHQIFGDGHSQPGSLNALCGAVRLACKGVEDGAQVIRADADPIVPDGDADALLDRGSS